MADGAVSLTLTPESRALLNTWGADKRRDFDRVTDMWLDRITAWALRETMRAFDSGGQPGGNSWPGNVGRYADWKASLGSNKPGILTGALRRSFAQNINYTLKEARIGSTLPYAAAVYYGKNTGWSGTVVGPTGAREWFAFSGMRARPFFPAKAYRDRHATELFNDLVKWKMRTA